MYCGVMLPLLIIYIYMCRSDQLLMEVLQYNCLILMSVVQSEKELLHDQIRHDLEERIRRLEEDRHNIDISSGGCACCTLYLVTIMPTKSHSYLLLKMNFHQE